MFDGKWKFLIVSIIVYQGLLTLCLFDLVDVTAYLAREGRCGNCDGLFPFILTNQGGSDAAAFFTWCSALLILVNVVVWILSMRRRRPEAKPEDRA